MPGERVEAALVLAAFVVGCASTAPVQPLSWKDYRPTTPLPAFAAELGYPCAEDWGDVPLHVKCGRGRRASVLIWRDHQAVTGTWAPGCGSFCSDMSHQQHEQPLHFTYPPQLSAKSDGKHAYVDYSLYIDGPIVWLKAVARLSQFGGAALTIIDRRLLSQANERWLAKCLKLVNPSDIYDDRRLIRGVEEYREW